MRTSRSRARVQRRRRSPHLHRPAFLRNLSPSALTAPQQPSSSPLPFPPPHSRALSSPALRPSLVLFPSHSRSLSKLPAPSSSSARSLSRRTLRPLRCCCVRFRGSCARREERSAARAPLSRQTAPAEHASSPVAKKKWDSCPEDLRSRAVDHGCTGSACRLQPLASTPAGLARASRQQVPGSLSGVAS